MWKHEDEHKLHKHKATDVPDVKTYSKPSYSQNEDDSDDHYNVGDFHT